LSAQLDSSRANSDELTSRCAALAAQLRETWEELTATREDRAARGAAWEAQKSLLALEQAAVVAHMEEDIDEMLQQLADTQGLLAKKVRQHQKERARAEASEQSQSKTESSLRRLHEDLGTQLQRRVAELRAEEAEVARLRLALAEQKARAESLSGVLGTTEADLFAERKRTAALEAALAVSEARVVGLRRDVAALDATVAERETTLAQLQENLAATQEAERQAGIKSAVTIMGLDNQLAELQRNLSSTERDLANRVRQHRGERARADAAEKLQQATSSELGKLRTTHAELEQSLHEAGLELQLSRSDLDATRDELEATEDELGFTSSELALMQEELAARLEELGAGRAEASARHEQIEQLETTVRGFCDPLWPFMMMMTPTQSYSYR
jgi:DNA repair exonuclease SbcCD ATPase subunit